MSPARACRSVFDFPCTSRPNATLSSTRRWGSNPKCWNTIETRLRRSSRSHSAEQSAMSSPSMITCPAVGSMSRLMQRTRVDFPEPERPITTNTLPSGTSKLTSRTAATQPVRASNSARGRSASAEPTTRSACGPNTFHTPRHEIVGVPPEVAAAAAWSVGSVAVLMNGGAGARRRWPGRSRADPRSRRSRPS